MLIFWARANVVTCGGRRIAGVANDWYSNLDRIIYAISSSRVQVAYIPREILRIAQDTNISDGAKLGLCSDGKHSGSRNKAPQPSPFTTLYHQSTRPYRIHPAFVVQRSVRHSFRQLLPRISARHPRPGHQINTRIYPPSSAAHITRPVSLTPPACSLALDSVSSHSEPYPAASPLLQHMPHE